MKEEMWKTPVRYLRVFLLRPLHLCHRPIDIRYVRACERA